MALLTLLARFNDGMPLSASIQDDNQVKSDLSEFQQRAKKIFRKLTPQSPRRCSIDCDPLIFHYIVEDDICYLVLCEKSYSPTTAFSYLEAIHEAFYDQHGSDIYKASRPYHFIEFGTEIARIKRNFVENQSRRTTQLKGLSQNLQDVQHIMFDNIDAVLQRGELINTLDKKASHLADASKIFSSQARTLNLRTSLAAKVAIGVVILLFIVFVRFWFF